MKKKKMTKVIVTKSGNYVAMINGVETFISADGERSNPVIEPCFNYLVRKRKAKVYETTETLPNMIYWAVRQITRTKRKRITKVNG